MRKILTQVFVDHSQELYRAILPILKNVDDTDDIMNDLFLKIQTTASKLLPTKNCKAWLHTTARNLARNKVKHDSYCSPVEWLDDVAHPSSLEAKVQKKLDFEILVSQLKGTRKRIVVEKIRNERTHREIALLLGLPEGTVRRQYREAIVELRQYLDSLEKKK